MSSHRKRKSQAEDALASPLQPGTVSDSSIEQQSRRRNIARARRSANVEVNREHLLWRAVNREKQLEALNRETLQVVSGWTFDPSSSNNSNGSPAPPLRGGRNLDVAEYLRAAKEIENRYGGVSGPIVTYGNNESSQLGIPDLLNEKVKYVYPPRRVPGTLSPGVRNFACGGLHNVVLLENGQVMTWGCSDGGPLGRPAVEDDSEPTPTLVKGFISKNGTKEDGQVISVAAGDSHTLYLTQNGNVYMTGMYKDADSGQFHDVRSPDESPEGSNFTPVHVSLLPQNVMEIYARGGYNAAMLSDRSIVTWGFGNSGELARSADMISLNDKGLFEMKKPHIKGDNSYDLDFIRKKFLNPSPVHYAFGGTKKIVLTAACGSFHLLVVARENNQFQSTLYSSGLNQYGQLGLGDKVDRHELTPVTALKDVNVGQVAAGMHHSMCLNLTGSQVYSWGRKDYGQLGLGDTKAAAGEFQSTPSLVKFPALEGPKVHLFSDIACGDHTSMALTVDHDLYTWGYEGTTGHGKFNNKDLFLPKKLNINDTLKQKDTEKKNTAVVYKIASGGQHSALLVKRFADNN